MAIHVTIDPESGIPVEQYADAMQRLAPQAIAVDMSGPHGRVLLASLQARGLPANALEKRPRPTLPEIQRAEELSRELDAAREKARLQDLELRLLREHQKHLHTLIDRLD